MEHETETLTTDFVPYRLRLARSEFRGKQVTIDREGWRLHGDRKEMFDGWSASNYNIFIFGGSALYGHLNNDNETIPYHLETLMGSHSGKAVKVYNFGQVNYSSNEGLSLLVQQLQLGRVPDVAVFYDGANEVGRGTAGSTYENVHAPYVEADYGWFQVVRTYRAGERSVNPARFELGILAGRLHHLLDRMTGRWARQKQLSESVFDRKTLESHAKDAARAYVRIANVASKLGSSYGFQTIFILQPLGVCLNDPSAYNFPYYPGPREWEVVYYHALYKEILISAQSTSLRPIDMCRELNGVVARGESPFNTRLHLNGRGNAYMAEQLASRIVLDGAHHRKQ
ncbi:MAG: hypothetical protein FJ245_09745 [Nitrospira sp.]|nr:hypothetical protein [Nitrospira sp.]